jgi:hypothetical protein
MVPWLRSRIAETPVVENPQSPPKLRIKFVSPDEVRKRPRKRLSPSEAGIQARLEHVYPIKALIEELFGRSAFMKIKMGGSMRD